MSDISIRKDKYPDLVNHITGLSADEVSARTAASNLVSEQVGPSISDLLRKYVLTIFNLGLFSLVVLQLLFQKPLDALVSALLMLVGISINVGQELWARRRLAQITSDRIETTRVIRSGKIQEIHLRQIVPDDINLVSREDLIYADGTLIEAEHFLVDESLITGKSRPQIKEKGSQVLAGSICLDGTAALQVTTLPQNSQAYRQLQQIEYQPQEYSPLQRLIDRVLRALIVIVTYFGVLLVLDYALVGSNILNHSSMAAMVFGLAPNGLFFMIILSYTMGVTMISGRGALIPNITDIEALAQVSVLCLNKAPSLTHFNVDYQVFTPGDGGTVLTQKDLVQLTADCAKNNRSHHPVFHELAAASHPRSRSTTLDKPFSMDDGWSAVAFEDDPTSMVYFIGLESILEQYITNTSEISQTHENESKSTKGRMGIVGRVRKAFQRPKKASRRLISTLMYGNQVELILAYAPHNMIDQREIFIPEGIKALGKITFSEEIHQDTREMIDFFSQAGVDIKILSDEDLGSTLQFAEHIELLSDSNLENKLASGEQLGNLDKNEFSQTVQNHNMFYQLSGEQKGDIVQSMREQGEYVGVLGTSINDLVALKHANMWITPESGSPALRRFANIVLLKNSLATLRFVFREGERIINGLSDVFRVYLTQIFYFALLIVTIGILDLGFPLSGKQNSAVTLVTVHVPAMALSIFAVPGKTPRGKLVDMLFHFVVPAGIMTSIIGFSMYFYFLISSNNLEYAQLAMTHVLVFCGALTILFVEPPLPFFAGGNFYRGNKWPAIVVLSLVIIFLLLSPTWLGKELFDLQPLSSWLDYLIILGVALLYGLALKALWRFRIFDRYMRIDLETNLEPSATADV